MAQSRTRRTRTEAITDGLGGLLSGGAAGGDGTTDDLLPQPVTAAGHLAGGQGARSYVTIDIEATGGGTAYPGYIGLHQALIAL